MNIIALSNLVKRQLNKIKSSYSTTFNAPVKSKAFEGIVCFGAFFISLFCLFSIEAHALASQPSFTPSNSPALTYAANNSNSAVTRSQYNSSTNAEQKTPPASTPVPKERKVGLISISVTSSEKEILSLGLVPEDIARYIRGVSHVFNTSFASHPTLSNPSVISLMFTVTSIPGKSAELCKKNYRQCVLMKIEVDSKGDIDEVMLEKFLNTMLTVPEVKIKNFDSKEEFVFSTYYTLSPEIYDKAMSIMSEPDSSQSCPNPNRRPKGFSV